jgi:hypothetical protein
MLEVIEGAQLASFSASWGVAQSQSAWGVALARENWSSQDWGKAESADMLTTSIELIAFVGI